MYYVTSLSRKYALALLLLLGCALPAFAQPTVDFNAAPRIGCSPLLVNFINMSSTTGNPTYRWELGNGVISTQQSPSTTYVTPGTYSIKLVVENSQGKDSLTRQSFITVLPSPTVDFSAVNNIGCTPLNVQFSDATTTIGNITTWNWDFGDGSLATTANPSHLYTVSGLYNVTLLVTNNNGCTRSITKPQFVNVADKPVADFTESNPVNCVVPHTVNFTNTSTGTGNSYQWNFGDGNNSTQASPAHTYTAAGTYTVTLVVTNANGCTDTKVKTALVKVGSTTSFTVGTPVCAGTPLTLTNNSVPAPSAQLWEFGDATSATDFTPVKTYNTPGTYSIKLTNQFGACSDVSTHTITVLPKPTADFTANNTTSCSAPLTVTFTNNSVGGATYLWDFGDGNSSTQANPVHTYSATGFYTVTLKVTNAGGCSDTQVRAGYIQVQKPQISIAGLPKTGCAPITINPVPTVQANEPITSWAWNFGDGNTSNVQNPTHIYNTAGTYDVTLTVTTASGCTNTLVLSSAVQAGVRPAAAFNFTPPTVCATNSVQFSSTSTGTITSYLWDFGDGGTSSAQNPGYQYNDTGTFSVRLVVSNLTCRDTLLLEDIIRVLPPVARFTADGNCADKLTKTFTNTSIIDPLMPVTWLWDFGDGNTSSAQQPSHTYGTTGSYTVKLTVTNGTCTHFVQRVVSVIVENAAFTPESPAVCKGVPMQFTAAAGASPNIVSWAWDFGDGGTAATAGSATHAYNNSGDYTVTLTITDALGCTDVQTRSVRVNGPFANFTQSATTACFVAGGNTISFTDQSIFDGQNAIVKWIWNWGDGSDIDSSGATPFQHVYTVPGTYSVNLSVRDAAGCYGYFTVPSSVVISKPEASFSTNDTLLCTNRMVNFSNQSTGNGPLQYSWNFGDGSPANLQETPSHPYSATGLYTIKLTVTDIYGCTSTMERPDYVTIAFPYAQFRMSDSLANCPPLVVNFTNLSGAYTSQVWDFGDGSTSALSAPAHIYSNAGNFIVKLKVTGPGGCTDEISRPVIVKGPTGTFSYTPITGCQPLTVTFSSTTAHRDSLIWDFGNGVTQWDRALPTDIVLNATHTYTDTGRFVPRIILIDTTLGCSVPITGTDTIFAYRVYGKMDADQYNLCDSGYVQFSGQSTSNGAITGWQWNFGDGFTSTDQNPLHKYTTPGTYTATLTTTGQAGCSDAVTSMPITVHVSPQTDLTPPAVAACVPATVSFAGQVLRDPGGGTLSWKWDFGNGQTATTQNPAAQLYPTAGSFTARVILTHSNGCSDTTDRNVLVRPLPVVDAGSDLRLCRDSVVTLTATGATSYQWDASSVLSCLSCPSPQANPLSNTTFWVTGTDAFGCSARDSVRIDVKQHFVMQRPVLRDTLCRGERLQLHSGGADFYTWTPATYLDNANSANPTATPDTTITYTVVVRDSSNCFIDSAHVTLRVYPVPTVNAGPDLVLAAGDTATIHTTSSADVTSWQWAPAGTLSCATCPAPLLTARNSSLYRVMVRNEGGCSSYDDMNVTVLCGGGNIFIPNTFSPNGDGMNDVFYPRGTGISNIRSFRVFNRWGELVYERTNIKANDVLVGWNGMYKGKPASPDVYVYTMEVLCSNNELLPIKGDVTVLQ
ncbi:MAG: PKD domain-containing protein [Chitinophagaceae bacterium]|nr:MAG: PKD domain-containing protein [Chitinophagaceae bacterium]